MADSKLLDLTSASSAATTDVLYLSTAAGADRKITLQTLFANVPSKLSVSSGGAEFGGVNPEVIVESTDASTPTLTLRNETIGASNVFYKFQKRTDNKLLIFGFDGTTVKNVLEHTYSTGATEFSGKLTVSSGGADITGTLDATAYEVGGVAGVDFSGSVTNITVIKGLVTAAS